MTLDLKTAHDALFPGYIAHHNNPVTGVTTFVTQLSF